MASTPDTGRQTRLEHRSEGNDAAKTKLKTLHVNFYYGSLQDQCTIVIMTHNLQQAARVAEYTGFFLMGSLIEFDETTIIFKRPAQQETEDYITGRFG